MRIQMPEYSKMDDRGTIVQLATGNWKQIKMIFIMKGKSRGGHFHKKNEELFMVINGRMELEIPSPDGKRIYIFKNGDSFVVEKGELHTLNALDDTLLMEVTTEPYDPSDTYQG